MKRFILLAITAIALAIAPTVQSEAQFGLAKKQAIVAGDTLTNTDTLTKIYTFSDGYSGITVTAVATKVSGTVSSKIRFLRSNTGSDWFAYDSLLLTDLAGRQWKDVSLTTPVPVYVKVETITSGTQKFAQEFWILSRRYPTTAAH